jgi:hypothetical protein
VRTVRAERAGRKEKPMLTRTISAALATLGVAASAAACSAAGDPTEEVGEAELGARQFCGGIAALPCPAGHECVDDRSDDCDPAQGGADCGGVCVRARGGKKGCRYGDPSRQWVSRSADQCAAIRFYCEQGTPFSDRCGCGCDLGAGTPCGGSVCGAGEFCCNASCGICAPLGGACIQIACG